MPTIRAATEILEDKERMMRKLSVDYGIAIQRDFNAAQVDTMYDEVNKRWTKSQAEITTAMDHIADILKAIREAYESVEDQLTSALAGDGGSASAGSSA